MGCQGDPLEKSVAHDIEQKATSGRLKPSRGDFEVA
jgi:hypothetical protein